MSTPVLNYQARDGRRAARRAACAAGVVAAVAGVAVWFGVLKGWRSAPASTDSFDSMESADVYGLASRLTEFTAGNGGNYPSRLEQLPGVQSLNRARGLTFIGVREDGRSLEYRLGALTVVYSGPPQDAPGSDEVRVIRATSSATFRCFDIVSVEDNTPTALGPVTHFVRYRGSVADVGSAQ